METLKSLATMIDDMATPLDEYLLLKRMEKLVKAGIEETAPGASKWWTNSGEPKKAMSCELTHQTGARQWSFSPAIKKLDDELKAAKSVEQDNGTATSTRKEVNCLFKVSVKSWPGGKQ